MNNIILCLPDNPRKNKKSTFSDKKFSESKNPYCDRKLKYITKL